MPRRQPFTQMCQQAARLARLGAADLHTHTTASDGDFTPSQIVVVARSVGLAVVAITDHDTTAGLADATATAAAFTTRPIRVVPGVEVSAEQWGREYHILGYFISPADSRLATALDHVRTLRRTRFREFVDGLTRRGTRFPGGMVEGVEARSPSLGRRHLAYLLVRAGVATTKADAFRGYINPVSTSVNHRLPLAEAVGVITGAGGIASLAHPGAEMTQSDLAELRGFGVRAVEAYFPAATPGRTAELRRWAGQLGLHVTGGSDYHGPAGGARSLGSPGLPLSDFNALAEMADCPV